MVLLLGDVVHPHSSGSSSESWRKEQADRMPCLVGHQQLLSSGGGIGGMELQKQRQQQQATRIDGLLQLVGGPSETSTALQDSLRPAKDFLKNDEIAEVIISKISEPQSGKGSDQLCQWFYESYQTKDPDLQAVVLRYVPTLCGVYFSRSSIDMVEPLAGFEAVLLALYTEEARARGGKPLMINLPNLSQPSLYHTPPEVPRTSAAAKQDHFSGLLNPPLEPQPAVKSTKRAAIVGIALELFWRRITVMPLKSKFEFCQHAQRWAVLGCSWASQVDEIARVALLPVKPVAPPAKVERMPELGHALATGESLAVSQTVFEQPPHQRILETTKAALIDRTTSEFTSSVGSVSFNSATSSVELLLEDETEELRAKLPLPLDLLRPIFKVLGHCLMAPASTGDLKDAALVAARALFVRASEDLDPEAILASRSLVRLGTASKAEPQVADESTSFAHSGSGQLVSMSADGSTLSR
ncbi:unnamed protein product [Calypogeia fissa]